MTIAMSIDTILYRRSNIYWICAKFRNFAVVVGEDHRDW